jgi:hypothetical protein
VAHLQRSGQEGRHPQDVTPTWFATAG